MAEQPVRSQIHATDPELEIPMFYSKSDKVIKLKRRLQSFMDRHVYPNEERFYKPAEELGPRARTLARSSSAN
jgi:hypothetical protein